MRAKKMAAAGVDGVESGGNALIWLRQLPRARGGSTRFYRSLLHPHMWDVLKSETAGVA